jgi:tetratricopeptide (TPR) repeat protein
MGAYADAQGVAPAAPELHYDTGNVLYRQENWEGAREAYGRALASASPDLAGRAAYNLGNAHFKDGKFEEAAQAYRRSLRAAPGDVDAKRNLELALQALAQEQKRQDRNKPQPDEQQKDKDQQEKEQEPEEKGKGDGKPQQKPQPQPQPGEMTPEQAKQLLERLADQEKENVKREAARRVQAEPSRNPEKDW